MKDRIRHTRWPDDWANQYGHYGVERTWLQDLSAYWSDEFDWRAQEEEINRLPHFTADLDGFPIHFAHVRGKGPNPIPLILTHGWPWTFWDWKDVIGPLTDPEAYGLDPRVSFDVVVPSLPGYGFSTPLKQTGVTVRRVAALWVRLMREVLGYDKFAAAGGDWGSMITSEMGHASPEPLLGVHLAMPMIPGYNPTLLTEEDFASDESWMWQRHAEATPLIASHLTVHMHEPQTLAYALSDSPVGLAAWIWARRQMWSDGSDPVEVFGRDFLCTTASIYWLTNTIGTSMRFYRDHFGQPWNPLSQGRKTITVPTAFAIAPKELVMMPRRIAAERTNLAHWEILPAGGHFGPAENPRQFIDSYRAFFGMLTDKIGASPHAV